MFISCILHGLLNVYFHTFWFLISIFIPIEKSIAWGTSMFKLIKDKKKRLKIKTTRTSKEKNGQRAKK